MLRQIARGAPSVENLRTYNVPNPAANANVVFPVPGHRAWLLCAVSAKLTASAVAGNRVPLLTLGNAQGSILAQIGSPTAITANLAPTVSWVPGIGTPAVVAASFAALSLPSPWYMTAQDTVTISGTTDATDQWSAVRITVVEVNTGDPAFIDSLERGLEDRIEAAHELFR